MTFDVDLSTVAPDVAAQAWGRKMAQTIVRAAGSASQPPTAAPKAGAALLSPDPQAAPTPAPSAAAGSPGAAAVRVIQPPAPNGMLIRHVDTNVTFTDNPEYVQFQLQEYVSRNGLDSLKRFDQGLLVPASPILSVDPKGNQPPPDGDAAYMQRVAKGLHEQVVPLRVHIDDYRENFQRRANDHRQPILATGMAKRARSPE